MGIQIQKGATSVIVDDDKRSRWPSTVTYIDVKDHIDQGIWNKWKIKLMK